ncbi:DUF465 domain-containing protein [Novosphingobium profundi]|uniref:DUF465 domain-containing protein n=1 Tax=Novosphingobium profundi TaxID=1774954 RepID=UPI001BDB22E2|nr:DUF465 domain-containing protein [Novosphingobium profundi]MBT0671169.1 DUF465 domain-containing protein [Novosphingobium profundi]
MTEKMFRTLEKLQRIDSRLRRAQRGRRSDRGEIARLMGIKNGIRERLSRLSIPLTPA